MVDCRAYGVKTMVNPQGQICGNTIELPPGETESSVRSVSRAVRSPLVLVRGICVSAGIVCGVI